MKIKFIDQAIDYDGTQLVSHWIYKNFELADNAAVAFIGKCDVRTEKMVDLSDSLAGKNIYSEKMLHLIVELFDTDLTRTILLQRLLVSLAQQEIAFRSKNPTLIRAGNDLYEGEAKLSVSIATSSPISTLIHFGINISSQNTPVKTKGLADYPIEPKEFSLSLLETFKHEWMSVAIARSKVRGVS